MNIEVRNLSSSSAIISWKPNEPCLEDHYHVMYRASWNNIFTGYLRNSFHYEEKVPRTVRRALLEHLAPSTFYFLCVSCKKLAYPQSHYCTMFYTPDKDPMVPRGYLLNPQASMWVLVAILLACFTAILTFICLQYWCSRCPAPRSSYREPHVVQANGLVRWPRDGRAADQGEGEQQGLPLVQVPHRDSGAGVEPEAAAKAKANADRDAPDAGAPQREGGGQPGFLPHFKG